MDQLTTIRSLAEEIVEAIDLELDRRQLNADAAALDTVKEVFDAREIDESTAPVATRQDAQEAAIRLSKRPGGLS